MTDGMETVLRLVAEGRLTADEAAPILDALSGPSGAAPQPGDGSVRGDRDDDGRPRYARLEVRDHGRRVVDLRIPISLGLFALDRVPGLSAEHIADVERAVASNTHGPIVDVVDTDGDGVRIVLE